MRKYIISVDSRDRNYEHYKDPNEYVIKLPNVYKNICCATLLNCEIPSSFYIFADYLHNTSLKVIVHVSSTLSFNKTITIPDGNYNDYSMKEELESALNQSFSELDVIFRINIIVTTLKLVITNNKGYEVQIDTTGALPKRTDWGLGYYLGFNNNTITDKAVVVNSPSVVTFNPYTYMFLEIEGLNMVEECGSSQGTRTAFAKIPIPVASFEFLYLDSKNVSFGNSMLNPTIGKLDRLKVVWRFHDGNLIDFNNVEHSFSIELLTNDVLAA